MPQTCRTCTHPERKQIDAEILKNTPLSAIAKRWNLSKVGVWRHKAHLSPKLIQSAEAAQDVQRAELEREIDQLIQSAKTLHHRAKRKRNSEATLKAIREVSRLVELKARLSGKLSEGETASQLHVHLSPERALQIARTFVERHDPKTLPKRLPAGWPASENRRVVPRVMVPDFARDRTELWLESQRNTRP